MSEKKYILEQTPEEETRKKEFTDRMPTVVKVLDSLVFDKPNINYSIKLRQMTRAQGANKLGFYIEIDMDVEVDRMNRSLPVFDQAYEDSMFQMEDKISAALGYVGLQSYFSGALLTYINDYETEKQMDELMDALFDEIQKEYPNVPLDRIKEAELYYYLYKQEDENPYIRVEVGGNEVIAERFKNHPDETLIDCDELWDIMSRVYENHIIGNAFDLENFICN